MNTSGLTNGPPSLTDAQSAVRHFLQEALPDVHRVDVTKVMRVASGEGAWEAAALVWQPNATLQALGLSTRRVVLDQTSYVVRLDDQLNVIAYETDDA
jgi:hypothetical protein